MVEGQIVVIFSRLGFLLCQQLADIIYTNVQPKIGLCINYCKWF